MKTTNTIVALVSALSAWSDGPKYVFIHPAPMNTNYEALKIAENHGASIFISDLEMTADYFIKMIGSKPGSFFIVGVPSEAEGVQAIVSSRPDLDIRFATL